MVLHRRVSVSIEKTEIKLHVTVTQQLVWDSKQGKELVFTF